MAKQPLIADILIVDDHPMVRKGLAQLISMEPLLNLVGEVSSGAEAVEFIAKCHADLILLDLKMPKQDGVETIRQLRRLEVGARIIVFTVSNDHSDVFEALRTGADGYLLKDMEPEALIASIFEAVNGRRAFSPELIGVISKALKDLKTLPSDPDLNALTNREKQVLGLIANGLTNKEIAHELGISVGTAKAHVMRLLKKMGMHSRIEVAIWVIENRNYIKASKSLYGVL